jgi:hypothetical protein
MLPRRHVCLRLFVVCGLAVLSVWSLAGETRPTTAVPVSRMIRFDVPGGESLFALSIKAAQLEPAEAHDVAIVIDTSASQAGEHRRQALAVLESCLASLAATDRVLLIAVDTQVKSLSADFAAPQSPETKAALAALQQRVPLGATDLQPALETALRSLQGDRPHSLIYIGDGMSTGKLIEWTGFRTLINGFRRQQVPVTSYAIGPRTDLQVLGILAEHTGGVVLVDALIDDTKLSPEKLGQKLARAAEATVFYADELTVSPEIHKLLPRVVPPIRADRETIVLGEGTIPALLKVTANGAGRSLSWTVKPAASQPGNTFLTGLWQQAEQSDGLLVATAGNELLNVAREEFEDQVQQLLVVGRQAVAARDLKQAEQIAQAVRQIDPANVEAETILNASQKIKENVRAIHQVALTRQKEAEETPEPPVAGIDANPEQPATAKGINLLDDQRQLMKLRAEKLAKEVARTIDLINRVGSSDPEASLGTLKRTLTSVVSSTDIDADVREKLRAKVQASIDRLAVALNKLEMDRITTQEMASAVKAKELATEALVQRDEQLEQLIAKVSSLMYEGYIGNADAFERAEEVARASFELAPYQGVTVAAIYDSEAAGQLDKSQRLRYRRYDQFLATLYQLELAHIPFPDEPPIVYPAPEVWKSLTERRRKWASVDLMKWNPAEEKIRRAYDRPTNVEWQELALEDCITFLAEFHGINIILDKAKLTEEGVALDQPITLKLQGVTLRSVLKLLLEPVQLTYMVENEVMKITTSASAADKLSTRVYPVGDLVIPIITPRAGMGGMGMMGGMGGGMGGMGGGMGGGMMGGMGGGMGGMGGGMMGGGMGMMNVADPDADVFDNNAVKSSKKKALPLK